MLSRQGVPTRADRLRGASWCFVLLALGWTWAFGFTAAATGASAGHPLHLLSLAGPVVGWAAALTAFTTTTYRRRLLRRVVDVREVSPRGWGAVALVGAGPALLATGVVAAAGGDVAPEPSLTVVSTAGIVAFALAAGLAEEPGWRGILVDAAPAHALAGPVLGLGVVWSAWHAPLYLVDGTYQHGLAVGSADFWLSVAGPVPLAVLLVWLVRQSRGAVVAAVTAHALGNTAGEVLAIDGAAAVVVLVVTALAAAGVLLTWGRAGVRDPAASGPLRGRT